MFVILPYLFLSNDAKSSRLYLLDNVPLTAPGIDVSKRRLRIETVSQSLPSSGNIFSNRSAVTDLRACDKIRLCYLAPRTC